MHQTNEVISIFGKRIAYLRQNQKLSQEKLAEKSGLHRTYIGMVERAKRNISLLNINKLANGLGVSIDELFKF
jgi:transcriptional regulator with XRE-family HTH domain